MRPDELKIIKKYAYDMTTLSDWYQNSIDETVEPIWTDKHLEELMTDFYLIPKE